MRNRVIALMMILALVFAAGCENAPSAKINVYFADTSSENEDMLVSESRTVALENPSASELVTFAVECLIAGPTSPLLGGVAPEGLSLISASVAGGRATVDFSSEYYAASGTDELVLRYAVVRTLCELTGIDRVRILVNGSDIVSQSDGVTPIGDMVRSDVVGNILTTVSEKVKLTLYFPDESGEKLVGVSREAEMPSSRSLERMVVTELLNGPKVDGLYSTIPSDAKLIDVEVKDGVCFVNFSDEFVTKASGGTTSDTMTIYSIVNSLTELETVNAVQFMISGKTDVEFGNFVFDEPFARNESLIKKQ